jgi:hypothetical protein
MQTAGEDILVAQLSSCPKALYRRDGADVAHARARRGSTHAVTTDSDGFSVHVRFADFFLLAADLPAGFEPAVGDVVWHGGWPYLVSAVDGEPCWRWHTRQSRRIFRVHTRQISTSHPAAGASTP